MTEIVYPLRWLAESVGTSFILRHPWVDEVREAAARSEALCILLPEVAGPLAEWGSWLLDSADEEAQARFLTSDGTFCEASHVLAESYQVGEGFSGGRPLEWARRFLAESRRQMPQIDTVPLLVIGADDECAVALQELVQAQRELGFQFARPVLLRRTRPPDWSGEVVRFGSPELVGDLIRIAPPPEQDLSFWTNLMLALAVAWEAGATPQLADELWDFLRLQRTLSLRDHGFDHWLSRELDGFATRNQTSLGTPLPDSLAFGPLREVEDELWQCGAVAWHGDRFDVTPFRARLWAGKLSEGDIRDSLRRRRLTNIPLARWLSAWATSVEESLRVAVLQVGSMKFRRFLENQKPRNRRDPTLHSRLEELNLGDDVEVVNSADFGDLADFVSQAYPWPGASNKSNLLNLCRLARNRVVHQRIATTSDFLYIAYTSSWLNENFR
jgi:hypothetical protein